MRVFLCGLLILLVLPVARAAAVAEPNFKRNFGEWHAAFGKALKEKGMLAEDAELQDTEDLELEPKAWRLLNLVLLRAQEAAQNLKPPRDLPLPANTDDAKAIVKIRDDIAAAGDVFNRAIKPFKPPYESYLNDKWLCGGDGCWRDGLRVGCCSGCVLSCLGVSICPCVTEPLAICYFNCVGGGFAGLMASFCPCAIAGTIRYGIPQGYYAARIGCLRYRRDQARYEKHFPLRLLDREVPRNPGLLEFLQEDPVMKVILSFSQEGTLPNPKLESLFFTKEEWRKALPHPPADHVMI